MHVFIKIFLIHIFLHGLGIFNNKSLCLIRKPEVKKFKYYLNKGTTYLNKYTYSYIFQPFSYILCKKKYINLKKKKKVFVLSDNIYNELSDSHIYKIRKELSEGDIKTVFEKHIINKVLFENINKYNSFSYIYTIDDIYEQINKLYVIYEEYKKNEGHKKLPKLFGLPLVIKDNIITKSIPTKAGSKILSNYVPSYDSTVVKKLKKHGAVIIGKTHLDEFAMGSCTKEVKNPFNEKYLSCGGSSGGSASCVGSKIINCSVNTDTGGSIRTPSAMCACIGIKPTYGRISRYGIIPYNEETDVVGLIANNLYDCSILLDALCGKDKKDLTSLKKKTKFHLLLKKYYSSQKFRSDFPLKNVKFGFLSSHVLKSYFVDDIINKNYEDVMKNIEYLGGKLININLYKLIDYCYIYYIYSMTIANSNISRINGVNYNIHNLNNELKFIKKLRSNLISENVLSRIIGGSLISSYFQKIDIRDIFLSIKEKLITTLKKLFKEVNYILLPSFPRSNNLKDHINDSYLHNAYLKKNIINENNFFKNGINENYLNTNKIYKDSININNTDKDNGSKYNKYMKEVFSVISSITGFPSIVIPTGEFTKNFNEPLSFQLLSRNLNEIGLLKIALVYKEKMNVNKKIYENLKNSKNM
ncbi:glutamyl-tRNA(Gln) amidotransferase subunit A, putative [Plasmodium gallinaceum]|uniref:Glutamyl-tRNA(Gln) amidotransferase subunit A, putative n=1 Tax=Plasmodium gallinaceum TaxID=5849 RepID=A0A1J1GLA8_PLAGA|nr:glutamyl-tRNA(Gln) amidotransferase subunit A, putative [Plasmodium gallinaceum]CRG93192.1 glutamyl-tRNA(Gln) amidotransferase subunit A, putative [Plasmodium gallinaceum]